MCLGFLVLLGRWVASGGDIVCVGVWVGFGVAAAGVQVRCLGCFGWQIGVVVWFACWLTSGLHLGLLIELLSGLLFGLRCLVGFWVVVLLLALRLVTLLIGGVRFGCC